jgi:cytochrome P450
VDDARRRIHRRVDQNRAAGGERRRGDELMSARAIGAGIAPTRLRGAATRQWALRLMRDPLVAARRCHDAFGPFVMLADALPYYGRPRIPLLDVPVVLVAGSIFHREILDDPATWRPVSLLPGGPRGSAARRMTHGLMRMTGPRHAHYRKLLAAPLRRTSVDAMGSDMIRLAEQEIAAWPAGGVIELWSSIRRAVRSVTLGLLFGGDDDESRSIADAVTQITERKWARSALVFPVDLPLTPYRRLARDCEDLERRILAWAETKRGRNDTRDLAALIVNSPDLDGCPAGRETIAGHLPSLYAGATEAGQSTVFWTLILLAQHPDAARKLVAELRDCIAGARPSMEAIAALPLLDAVVKESMRLIPPVPLQVRVAQASTTLAGQRLPNRTHAVLGTFLTTRMPDLYPEPERFVPERWLKIDPTPFEFPVFSAGPRICPGYWFGLNAIKVTLAAILTRYRIAPAPNARVDYTIQPTMRPTGPVPVTLHPQDGAFTALSISGNVSDLVQIGGNSITE